MNARVNGRGEEMEEEIYKLKRLFSSKRTVMYKSPLVL